MVPESGGTVSTNETDPCALLLGIPDQAHWQSLAHVEQELLSVDMLLLATQTYTIAA